jgi:hypothetical protein
MNKKLLRDTYREIDSLVDRKELGLQNRFKPIVKAAFVKSLEFNLFVNSSSTRTSSAFFFMPSLRGMCEDLITLTYIRKKLSQEDGSRMVGALSDISLIEHLEKQIDFFRLERPTQPTVILPSKLQKSMQDKAEKTLTEIRARASWGQDKLRPSVSHMATECGMIRLYEFLYHATSDLVHFSPHSLLRMGWGDTEKQDFSYSTKNFSKYYLAFSQFYGTYLFLLFWREFAYVFSSKNQIRPLVKKLEGVIEEEERWIEIVSFEEMNRTPPNFFLARFQGKILATMSNRERGQLIKEILREREKRKLVEMTVKQKREALETLFSREENHVKLSKMSDQELSLLITDMNEVWLSRLKKSLSIQDANTLLLSIPPKELAELIKAVL